MKERRPPARGGAVLGARRVRSSRGSSEKETKEAVQCARRNEIVKREENGCREVFL